MLLAGLAIDSGLLYLAKARMGRAVDGMSGLALGTWGSVQAVAAGAAPGQLIPETGGGSMVAPLPKDIKFVPILVSYCDDVVRPGDLCQGKLTTHV